MGVSGHKNLLFRVMKNPGTANIKGILLPVLLLMLTLTASAQKDTFSNIASSYNITNLNIKSRIVLQTNYIRGLYSEKIETPKELINGKEYEPYYSRSKVKPLLFPEMGRTASIITGSRRYNNLTLQYDTFLDEVIYTDTSRTINYRFPLIALNKNIIYGFNLYFNNDSINFVYFREPECSEKNLKEGFYEVAYEGKSQYIIKHASTFYVREALNNYKYSPENYICLDKEFYRIKTAKSFLRLVGERSGDIKDFLHLSGIRFSKADKNQIISILIYYDTLVMSER